MNSDNIKDDGIDGVVIHADDDDDDSDYGGSVSDITTGWWYAYLYLSIYHLHLEITIPVHDDALSLLHNNIFTHPLFQSIDITTFLSWHGNMKFLCREIITYSSI